GAHQADVLGEQHPVTEHVPAHVPDAHDGEFLRLGVHSAFPEVSFDRLPRPPGGNAHGLVVVSGGATGGEGVIEPEVVLRGDLVGEVGEGGGALVRGDDQVGVVLVVAHHPFGRDDLITGTVVGDLEHPADEGAVGRLPRLHPGTAVLGRVGKLLGIEPALGPGGDDDGVLDHLRLDQAEHLGAEIFPSVAPAQAAPGDLAEAQVHPFDRGGVHPDLRGRYRAGDTGDEHAVDLHRDVVDRVAAGVITV